MAKQPTAFRTKLSMKFCYLLTVLGDNGFSRVMPALMVFCVRTGKSANHA